MYRTRREEIPVRSRSRPSSPAIHARASRTSALSSARAGLQGSRIRPPSWTPSGGSSTSAASRVFRRPSRSSSASPQSRIEGSGQRPACSRSAGTGSERHAERGEVAWTRHAQGHAAGEPREVSDPPEHLPDRRQERGLLHQGLDRIEPLPDLPRLAKGPKQPLTEEAPAHRRERPVDRREERPLRTSVVEALDQFQIARGALVQREVVVEREGLDPGEVRGRGLLRLLEIPEDGARRPDRATPARESQPLERRHAEVRPEAVLRLAEVEAPALTRGHGHPGRPEAREERVAGGHLRRHQDLRRPAEEERLGQALDVGGLTHPEVSRRHVGQGDPQVITPAPQRGQEVVATAVQQPRVGDGARGDQPHHLASDQLAPTGRRGLHLVADGDLQAGPDQSRDVGVDGVMRNSGHRNRALSLLPGGERDV